MLSESQRIYKNSFDNAAGPWFDLVNPLKPVTKAEMLKRLREATGMGWLQTKLFFAGRTDELCKKILRAHQEQTGQTLHAPTEDDSQFKDQIATARIAAEQNQKAWIFKQNQKLRDSGQGHLAREWPLGSCHRIWNLMKEDLKQQGISWYSPAEMNPGYHFD